MGLKLSHVLGGVLELLGTNSASSRTITFPDKDMTVAGTNDIIGGTQTLQDLTASRVIVTDTYTNTTGRPICVYIQVSLSANAVIQIFVDGIVVNSSESGTAVTGGVFAVIPDGVEYYARGSINTVTLTSWKELR